MEEKNDIEYKNSKGVEIKINFGAVVKECERYLQSVRIEYNRKEQGFEAKDYLVEAKNLSRDEKGNINSRTKEYFKDLEKNNFNILKGFFDPDSVKSQETNYLGEVGLGTNNLPNGTRYKDPKFNQQYTEKKRQEREKNKNINFVRNLEELTYTREEASARKLNVKTVHASVLTAAMEKETFANRAGNEFQR